MLIEQPLLIITVSIYILNYRNYPILNLLQKKKILMTLVRKIIHTVMATGDLVGWNIKK